MKKRLIACVLTLAMALGMSSLVACGGGNSGGSSTGGSSSTEASKPADSIVGSWSIDRVEVAGQKVDAAQMGITEDMYKFTFKDDGTAEFAMAGQSATAPYEVSSDGTIVLQGDAAGSADLGLKFTDGVLSMDVDSAKIVFKKA